MSTQRMDFSTALKVAKERSGVLINELMDVEVDFSDPNDPDGEIPAEALIKGDWTVEVRDRKINIKDLDAVIKRVKGKGFDSSEVAVVYNAMCEQFGFQL